jgi:hypothetical protein
MRKTRLTRLFLSWYQKTCGCSSDHGVEWYQKRCKHEVYYLFFYQILLSICLILKCQLIERIV